LETLLELSSKEKDEMRKMILDLTKQVAELRVTVNFLKVENEDLSKQSNKRPLKTK
jgi:hypothetical protein